ncbi:hypothetical protein LJD42_28470, partial [Escherichia coli]|nr:hypothetical protein [Escherichia coli]
MDFETGTSRIALATILFIASTTAARAQATQQAPAPVLMPIAASAVEPGADTQQTLVSDAGQQQGNDIIVTGTRATGITAAESAAPIKVLDADTLSHVGQPNLNQVLTQLVP